MARKRGEDIECFYTLTKEIALRLLNGRGEREGCTGAGVLGDRNLEFIEETVEPRKPNIAAKVQVEGATMSFKFMYTSRGISDPPFSPILPYQAGGYGRPVFPETLPCGSSAKPLQMNWIWRTPGSDDECGDLT